MEQLIVITLYHNTWEVGYKLYNRPLGYSRSRALQNHAVIRLLSLLKT